MLEQSITTMKNKIEYRTEELGKIKDFLRENCEHQLEIDYVDSMKNCEINSIIIKYCKKCDLTF